MFRKWMISFTTLLLMTVGGLTLQPSALAQGNADPTQPLPFYLLTIQGTLASKTVADAQALHNQTAGAAESVAAAKSLGDLSHMIYLPMQPAASGAGDVLFIDQWNSIDGLNQFFANPQVQEQAGQLFSQRDATVWMPAQGYYTYHLAAPYAKTDRIVAMVRGTVASREAAMIVHNQIVGSQVNAARMAGDISHDVYFKLSPPGEPESLEFLAVDVWMDAEGMSKYYGNPDFQAGISKLFTAPPTVSIWTQTAGDWVEW